MKDLGKKEKIGVVGAGLMGREIALVFALASFQVLLSDLTQESLAQAVERLRDILEKGIARVHYNPKTRILLCHGLKRPPTFGASSSLTTAGPDSCKHFAALARPH